MTDPLRAVSAAALLNASSDGILISDEKGTVVFINDAFEETTGLRRSQMLGKNQSDLLRQNLFNTSASLEVLRTGRPYSANHTYITGKHAFSSARPLLDEHNRIVGVLCNTRNIDELVNLQKKIQTIRRQQDLRETELSLLREQQLDFGGVKSCNPGMAKVIRLCHKVASFDSLVLIQGETGTGKEVMAKFIHRHSSRNKAPFIKVNCASIPEPLFESELFGYEKGSFTGALESGKKGLLEVANKGTLLLDEVNELPLRVQPKLLRFLQEKEIARVGGSASLPLDVRVIAACNRDLRQEVLAGRFREDLFFRLNVVPVYLPPLRERPEDIEGLINHFLTGLNTRYKKQIVLGSEVRRALQAYAFPGNVRELENILEYLFITAAGGENAGESGAGAVGEIAFEQLPAHILSGYMLQQQAELPEPERNRLDSMLGVFERTLITQGLKRHGTLRRAAKAFGIHASTLCRRMKKLRIPLP